MKGVHIIVTDYGDVKLSETTRMWLYSVDKEWVKLRADKKSRSKRVKRVREIVSQLEIDIAVVAKITWQYGGLLEEF